ncbi:hypothetical protein G9A89_001900 [Geosiphon pyriformis]|nr:hypothetical protein G9A89_001900 [Geosiphon pyriformis]
MVHRDLHSGNILQLSSYGVKIGDFGLCQPVNHKATTTEEKKGIFGVASYIPPEVIRGEKFTTAGDIYSFAMLLWELSTGRPPFHDHPHDNTLILNIVSKVLDVNPENCPNAREVKDKLEEIEEMYELMGLYEDDEVSKIMCS